MTLKKFIFIILIIFPIILKANEPVKIVNTFFELYKERGVEQAIDYLFSNNPILYSKSNSISNLKNTLKNIEKVLGKYHDFSIIFNENYYKSLQIIITYVRYEKQPLRYLFVFYKPDNKWLTFRFEIDTKFPENFIDDILNKNNIFFPKEDR
ncbi:MAG: hypothetical protein KatS3mg129_0782 [Leptospiraceae bacterium]|nr:MAG: hypothetical protein KatS3mg129_0782 [Leptospiraceae bacterium]